MDKENLDDARKTVDGWPSWKQRALGGGKPSVRRAYAALVAAKIVARAEVAGIDAAIRKVIGEK